MYYWGNSMYNSYYIVMIAAFVITLIAQIRVKTTFNKYSTVLSSTGMTGAMTAANLLASQGIGNVAIGRVQGSLTDHYNPSNNTLGLSEPVYDKTSLSAIAVAAHECGHAFQGWLTSTDPIREHADITMEAAETHSMSMEFFTEKWMNLLFGDRAQDYVDMHFEDSIMFIPYGTMVDEFQDIIYDDPALSPKARDEVWRDLEKQYKPHLDYSGNAYYEEGGFWQKQHHIYDNPLYYIDYCIAQTDALQYKVWMDEDFKAAWDSYLNFCKLSASDYFNVLIKQVGLNNPFEDGCLKNVADKLSKKLGL